ncbi:MAG TPA: DUF4440 domain-containing protein [Thermoanaerobaculia bacterium]|nr:DUF4440 domain-containing protein [Thermoanaerobaculia bacterium]
MKRLVTALVLALTALPAAASSAHEKELLSVVRSLMDSIAPGEKKPWEEHLTDDFLLIDRDGKLRRKPQLLEEVGPISKHYTLKLELTDIESADLGDGTAIIHYRVLEDMTIYGQPIHVEYVNSHVFVRSGDRWRMRLWQYVEIPADGAPVRVDASRLGDVAGEYQLAPGVRFVVKVRDGKLYGSRTGRPEVELVPESDDVFYVPQSEFRKIFVRDAKGKVVEMLDRRKGTDTRWKKVS